MERERERQMLKVLIADDESKVCQLIEKLVDWAALDMQVVATAENGIEALEKIREYHPDIAITDIRMPGYDGLELVRRRANREIGNLKIRIGEYYGVEEGRIWIDLEDE